MLCSLTCTPMTVSFTTSDDIDSGCKYRRVRLNAVKTEAFWVGSHSNLALTANWGCSVQVVWSKIQPSTIIHNLSLDFDSELSIKNHASKVAAVCYYQFWRLCQIWWPVGQEVATGLVLTVAMVISQLDYCNTALASLPQPTVAPLHITRMCSELTNLLDLWAEQTRKDHFMSAPVALATSICWYIQFILCCVMHSVFCGAHVSSISDEHCWTCFC